jgi:hypothetical protein
MARITFGSLSEAWKGEAADFTPLLSDQLDELGRAIGVKLVPNGAIEVATAGGRRIDILAQDLDGAEIVVENQYRSADHDHLTRGLAYAVARSARGLVVVAESHKDEFKAVAEYLNSLAEHDATSGISVWLVEARALRIEDSRWAPLFTAVVAPNSFTSSVEQEKATESKIRSDEDFIRLFVEGELREAAKQTLSAWRDGGNPRRFGPRTLVLQARGPSISGVHTVVGVNPDGSVYVPLSSYGGQNSGIPIAALTTDEFLDRAASLFGFQGTEKQPTTTPGWLTVAKVPDLLDFCRTVADAYQAARDELSM